ncbi:Uncharacterized protein PRO82_001174 [Candidatus Protochlamydia amoebophila]|uniref:hypothetical protein n=1 Tax=Candidatus Protochlamydia amoebophila TaxID=362787 RepID=UPI001BC967E3|nr:hypothetical protein [Candidatus Protochlamydia amoebophila]MBS4163868.1 Uncharacterized protein [Candidatus Protochlamydia amoebophila]
MKVPLFSFKMSRLALIIFWFIIGLIFLGIYAFDSTLFNKMRQVSYQDTPYINLPSGP